MGYLDTIKQADRMKEMDFASAHSNAKDAAYLRQLVNAKRAAEAKAQADAKLQAVHENALGTGYQAGESDALSKIWKAMEARRDAGIPVNEGAVE